MRFTPKSNACRTLFYSLHSIFNLEDPALGRPDGDIGVVLIPELERESYAPAERDQIRITRCGHQCCLYDEPSRSFRFRGGEDGSRLPGARPKFTHKDRPMPGENGPRTAKVVEILLESMGITDFEPRIVQQLLEYGYREQARPGCLRVSDWAFRALGYSTEVLQDAQVFAEHASRNSVQAADIRLAIESRAQQFLASPPTRDVGRQLGVDRAYLMAYPAPDSSSPNLRNVGTPCRCLLSRKPTEFDSPPIDILSRVSISRSCHRWELSFDRCRTMSDSSRVQVVGKRRREAEIAEDLEEQMAALQGQLISAAAGSQNMLPAAAPQAPVSAFPPTAIMRTVQATKPDDEEYD